MDTAEIVRLAEAMSAFSHDPDTQTACVLVLRASGAVVSAANCFPHGVYKQAHRLVRPEKYRWIEHAERRAIYEAARTGQTTLGATAYMLFAPCMDCARALIQAGIVRVVVSRKHHELKASPKWAQDFVDIHAMFSEAGVEFNWWTADSGHELHARTPAPASVPDLLKVYMQPAVVAIAEKIESDLLNLYAGFAANAVTNVSASGTMTGVRCEAMKLGQRCTQKPGHDGYHMEGNECWK